MAIETLEYKPASDLGKKVLYITSSASADDLVGYDKESLYIITDSSSQAKELARMGYYNVTFAPERSSITDSMIEHFTGTNYKSNSILFKSSELANLYESNIDEVEALTQLLLSLKDGNAEMFSSIVEVSLDDLLSKLTELQQIMSDADDVTALVGKVSGLQGQLQGYSRALKESEEAKESLSDSLVAANQRISQLTSRCTTLESNQPSESLTQEFERVKGTVQEYEAKIQALTSELESLRQEHITGEVETSEFSSKPDSIQVAEVAPEETKASSLLDVVAGSPGWKSQLPIINANMALMCDSMIYFKEVGHAIYLNALLDYLGVTVMQELRENPTNSTLILVYDSLENEFEVAKYKKHGFAINSAPGRLPIVVTNSVTWAFLDAVVNIKRYKHVILFDRLGVQEFVTNVDGVRTYFLVNGAGDIADYKLQPNTCVCFYDGPNVNYAITPSSILGQKDHRFRMAGFVKQACPWLNELLKDLGVVRS